MSIFMAKRKKKNDNPMTLLDFMILIGPITILGLAGLIAFFSNNWK